MAETFPQVGDIATDLRRTGKVHEQDRCGSTVTVNRITETLVMTSDGERYNRAGLYPVSEGRHSPRRLVPASDPRVIVVKGREHLRVLARTTENLAKLDHKTPEDVIAAFAQIVLAAGVSRHAVIELMRQATRDEQESVR